MAKILYVEDSEEVARTVKLALEHELHAVEYYSDGLDALAFLKSYPFDLAIFDWMVPGMDGVELCKAYRNNGGMAPVLLLTGRSGTIDKTFALDSGADDYLTKPFAPDEFLARVRALLRRSERSAIVKQKLVVGDLSLDPVSHEVSFAGTLIALLPKEFSILELFMLNPRKVYSAPEILVQAWKSTDFVTTDVVRTQIKNLRRKLTAVADQELIENVRSVGYRLLLK